MAKTRKPFFERLKTGLEEGIAHVKGELTLKTIDVPGSRTETGEANDVSHIIDRRSVAARRRQRRRQ
jgi:hypothetical protein